MNNNGNSLRYGILVPVALIIASFISCCRSYSEARQSITDDLNRAMIALADENRESWTRQDTITALRHMHEAIHMPVIYRASDVEFRNPALRDQVYFTLSLVDRNNTPAPRHGNMITSDSIILIPAKAPEGLALQLQGFAECSMASVISASDKTFPGMLLTLSLLTMACMFVMRRRSTDLTATAAPVTPSVPSIHSLRLTPMQRRLTGMLLDAPDRKVDKATLCSALWDDKINAEESLYTLVRRTKTALAGSGIEIVCNRGDSYELRINT